MFRATGCWILDAKTIVLKIALVTNTIVTTVDITKARNTIFYFRPVWASENILSSMFYNKTTNYLVLTDLQRRRLDFGSREEHTAK